MTTRPRLAIMIILASSMLALRLIAQGAPQTPTRVWRPKSLQSLQREALVSPDSETLDPGHTYTLADLIDLAEEHNPETRVAWQEAKSKAASLGIARGALYPTMSAVAIGASLRTGTLIGQFFHRQTEGIFEPALQVEYLVFDIGGRSGEIDAAKANLLASDLAFNDTHRRVIHQVASAYYRLLNAEGQLHAAEASLANAKAVEEDAQARLANGLATKPDELEAKAARAQAEYDLQAATGALDVARGELATTLAVTPGTPYRVEEIDALKMPSTVADSAKQQIDHALTQRPDLLEQFARLRAAKAEIKQAKSTYFPSLHFKGDGGLARVYGQQDFFPGSYAQGEVWTAELGLKWTLFDGARREYRIAEARADERATRAQIDVLRDEIAEEVWVTYSNLQTALRQQQAAEALLTASQQSYQAAHQAYGYGVRNLLDVVSAQNTLARARSEDITARTQLLLAVTDLAFETGDLIQVQHWSPGTQH
jgi:outer membrane protein